jgi:hypothetical protein
MTLQRALWASPLAVAVAVLAHLAVFGSGHAPGADHAASLWVVLLGGLGLSVGGAFIAGAIGSKFPIATNGRLGYAALLAASAATFGLIEFSEGHLAGAPWLSAILVMLPLALAVSWLAGSAGRAAYSAGAAFVAVVERDRRRRPALLILRRAAVPVRAASFASGTRRGRAPPLPL